MVHKRNIRVSRLTQHLLEFVLVTVEFLHIDIFVHSKFIFVLLLVSASLDSQRASELRDTVDFVAVSGNVTVLEELGRIGGSFHGLSIQRVTVLFLLYTEVVFFSWFLEKNLT